MADFFDASESSLAKSSLSGTPPPRIAPRTLSSFPSSVEHAPGAPAAHLPLATVHRVAIKVPDQADGTVPGLLHLPHNFEASPPSHGTAAILCSGAGGGVSGPSGIYLSLGDKLASLEHTRIPVLRMDYRFPARTRQCTADVLAAIEYLSTVLPTTNRFILIGWSFGSAPVLTAAAADKRIIGCALVAPQTAETSGITSLAPRPLLLLHGTGDRTLSYICSKRLYEAYGPTGDRRVCLYEGDDHALTRNAEEAEHAIVEFVARCAGVLGTLDEEERRVVQESLGRGKSVGVDVMRVGGDLDGQERVE